MSGLVDSAGSFRDKNVGVLKGTQVSHVAPKPRLVPELMENLFNWIKTDKVHALVKSCVAHYKIEFIHPFEDGNGRIGRFWQSLILREFNSVFTYIPTESLIKENQKIYYDTLEKCDRSGDSTMFIEFMLDLIEKSLRDYIKEHSNVILTSTDRLSNAKDHFKKNQFSRKDYLELFKNLSSASASRDLKEGLDIEVLKKIGSANQTKYLFN